MTVVAAPDAQGEALADALVAQAGDDQEEAVGSGVAEVREPGLVADQFELSPTHGDTTRRP